jgi:riboflavin kinase/FMN adenylyltransferase
VENTDAVNCETYLLDFEGDLYGKTVKTEFLHFLRGERRFLDVSELKAAVDQNILEAKAYFGGQKETKK